MTMSTEYEDVVGVDLGVLRLATLSTGELVLGAHSLKGSQRRLKRAQRVVSRRQKGSARRRRAVLRLSRAHARVAAVRRDHLHKLTTRMAKGHGRIVIEDLAVKNLMRNARGTIHEPGRNVRAKAGLNRAIGDAGWAELRRLLTYKCTWHGSRLVVAPRFFASSKQCSGCGAVKDGLSLSERTYRCDACGLVIERDLNAAINLAQWATAQEYVAGSALETLNARGEDVRPGSCRADLDEARTETVSEPAGLIGGPR